MTTVGPEGISAVLEDVGGAEARLEAELSLGGRATFDEVGTIEFSREHVLHFRSVGIGRFAASPDPNLKHGALVQQVDGGAGQFAGAEGLITSNFFVSETGEVTDNHLGLIFIHDPPTATERR